MCVCVRSCLHFKVAKNTLIKDTMRETNIMQNICMALTSIVRTHSQHILTTGDATQGRTTILLLVRAAVRCVRV